MTPTSHPRRGWATTSRASSPTCQQDEAVARIRTHVGTFWTPAMRERLQQLAAADSPDLDPLVTGAASRL